MAIASLRARCVRECVTDAGGKGIYQANQQQDPADGNDDSP